MPSLLKVSPLPVDLNQSISKVVGEEAESGQTLAAFQSAARLPPPHSGHPDPHSDSVYISEMSDLNRAIATGSYQLDPVLQLIAETAQKLTSATGAAIAMWKDGAVVCRASCGQGSPPLGAHLSVESGISGHCLRSGLIQHCGETLTDPRVDAELCRHLGLRSVAVLPIRGWRGVNGILEVFSTEPRAFAQQHFELLQHLAGLAERARAGQPELAPAEPARPQTTQPVSRLLPASDRLRDLASILISSKRRNLVLGTIALLGALLIGFVIWLGWRNPDEGKGTVNAAAPASEQPKSLNFKENDPVWKPNPGGEALFGGKRSPGIAASRQSPSSSQKSTQSKSEKSPEEIGASDTVVRYDSQPAPREADSETSDNPPVVAEAANPATLKSLLSASPRTPQLAAIPVSQGVSNGVLIHRVSPVYPPQALMARMEGNVVLDALIAEDGTVQDVKVVNGQPTLARAALQAVRQWRYKPFELDHKPVKMNTTITVKFKLP